MRSRYRAIGHDDPKHTPPNPSMAGTQRRQSCAFEKTGSAAMRPQSRPLPTKRSSDYHWQAVWQPHRDEAAVATACRPAQTGSASASGLYRPRHPGPEWARLRAMAGRARLRLGLYQAKRRQRPAFQQFIVAAQNQLLELLERILANHPQLSRTTRRAPRSTLTEHAASY